nr:hypothetical protein [Tanacetum cinerariifolium]
MSSLFADAHNMVTILEKSDVAEGFKQIIDFLSGSYIHYALTVNPHIYVFQWKFLIHTLLQSLNAKRTSWNEFSTAMASANQIGDLSTHTTRYISPALTQKVFGNMRRVGKGFSRVETPLFEGMLAARKITEEGIAEEQVQDDDAVAAAV